MATNSLQELTIGLLTAVFTENTEWIIKLVEEGADPNKSGTFENDNISPLSLACKRGSLGIVKALVLKGSDIGLPGTDGKTSLHYACEGDDKMFMDRNDEKQEDYLKIVEYLISNGASVDCKDNMDRTPLFTACEADDVQMVKLLVHHHCDVNMQTVDGDSPVKVACRNAKFWSYRRGREFGAAQPDPSNFPPIRITKLLLQASADISDATVLPTAVQYGNSALVKELLQLGMDINMLDDNQCTPLGAACSSVNVRYDIVKMLLEYGADVNKGGGWKKQKPLIFAYVHNSVDKIRLLLSYGAALTPEEMTELVSLSFSKSILENPEVIGPWSKELLSWRLLLAAGFQPMFQESQLAFKMQQLCICSSYEKISPWIWTMLNPLYSLKEWCRLSIRSKLQPCKDDKVKTLPLPHSLADFLMFKEFSQLDSKQTH